MAQKRMFSKTITNSDSFLDMPKSSQALYFHLNMSADDEGFIDSPKMIMRMIGAAEDDMKLLIIKNFIIEFDKGLVVVKDWRIHNTIRKDRIKPTIHTEEFKRLNIAENGSYTTDLYTGFQNVNQVSTNCPPSIDKISLDKTRLDKVSVVESSTENDNQPNNIIDISKVFDYFTENGFGSAYGNTVGEDIVGWVEDFKKIGSTESEACEVIIKALETSIFNNVRKWVYAKGVLRDWESKHLNNIEKIEAAENQRALQQTDSRKTYQKQPLRKETIPEWAGKEVKETPMSPEEQAEWDERLRNRGTE